MAPDADEAPGPSIEKDDMAHARSDLILGYSSLGLNSPVGVSGRAGRAA